MFFDLVPADVALEWIKILEKEGVKREIAENFIAEIRTHPKIFIDKVDKNTISKVNDVITEINFNNLKLKSNKKTIIRQMINILEDKLNIYESAKSYSLKISDWLSSIIYHEGIPTADDFGHDFRGDENEKVEIDNLPPKKKIVGHLISKNYGFICENFKDEDVDKILSLLEDFCLTSIRHYEHYFKISLFSGYDKEARTLLYKQLILPRMFHLTKDILKE